MLLNLAKEKERVWGCFEYFRVHTILRRTDIANCLQKPSVRMTTEPRFSIKIKATTLPSRPIQPTATANTSKKKNKRANKGTAPGRSMMGFRKGSTPQSPEKISQIQHFTCFVCAKANLCNPVTSRQQILHSMLSCWSPLVV